MRGCGWLCLRGCGADADLVVCMGVLAGGVEWEELDCVALGVGGSTAGVGDEASVVGDATIGVDDAISGVDDAPVAVGDSIADVGDSTAAVGNSRILLVWSAA